MSAQDVDKHDKCTLSSLLLTCLQQNFMRTELGKGWFQCNIHPLKTVPHCSTPLWCCPRQATGCWWYTAEAWQTAHWAPLGGGQSGADAAIWSWWGSRHWTEPTHQRSWKWMKCHAEWLFKDYFLMHKSLKYQYSDANSSQRGGCWLA